MSTESTLQHTHTHIQLDQQTHTSSTCDNHMTLIFDSLISGSIIAERLLWTVCLPSLILIALAAFLLDCGQTHTQSYRCHYHPIRISATASVSCEFTSTCCSTSRMIFAFSALTLWTAGHQEDYMNCKNWVERCQRGCTSEAKCKWSTYCPVYAAAIQSSHVLLESTMG